MVRAGDIFYPSHFPKRMEDSLGVEGASGVLGHTDRPSSSPESLLPHQPLRGAHGNMYTKGKRRNLEAESPRASSLQPLSSGMRIGREDDQSWPGPRKWRESAVREKGSGSMDRDPALE